MVTRILDKAFERLHFPFNWKEWGLRHQAVFGVVLIQFAITLALSVAQYKSQKNLLEDQNVADAEGVISSLSASTLSSILIHDFAEIDTLIQAHAKNNHISLIEIYDLEKKRIGYFSRIGSSPLAPLSVYHDHTVDEFPAHPQILQRTQRNLLISAPIQSAGKTYGWITLNKDEADLQKSLSNLLLQIFINSLVSLFIGYILAKRFADLFLSQINDLKKSVEKIGTGETNFRIEKIRNNELGDLARDFNRMADQISDYQVKMVTSAKYSALGEMAGGIAHEINNPLAIIVAKTTTLKKSIEKGNINNETLSTELQKISSTCFRITQIVNSLKNLARDGSNDLATWFDLKNSINESFDLSAEKLKNSNIKIDVRLLDNYEIYFSRLQLSQIFINLISNSMDAVSSQESPWISIQTEIAQGQFIIRFTDSGPGIPATVRQKMMEPFFSTKEVGKGTGLGLSISKGIIEKFNGQFYYNEKSPHTEFVIALKEFRITESKDQAA